MIVSVTADDTVDERQQRCNPYPHRRRSSLSLVVISRHFHPSPDPSSSSRIGGFPLHRELSGEESSCSLPRRAGELAESDGRDNKKERPARGSYKYRLFL
jgi:hypothetical protein